MKWYKIERTDGTIQYATKNDGLYYLYGTGFGIKLFDMLKSITPVDEVPVEYSKGYTFFDDGPVFEAYIDTNNWWNGWAMPWILKKDIQKFMDFLSDGDNYQLEWDGEDIHFTQIDEYTAVIGKTTINGEEAYYFGHFGLTFDYMRDDTEMIEKYHVICPNCNYHLGTWDRITNSEGKHLIAVDQRVDFGSSIKCSICTHEFELELKLN